MGERVEVVGPQGERGSVDASDLPALIAQRGRVATKDELNEEQYGGLANQAATATQGALDTVTAGGFTAGALQIAKALGRQSEVENTIKQARDSNPIAHALGAAAPLLAAPEAGGEELGALVKGESALANSARWALPHLYEGAAQTAWLEGSQGVSEDMLDHDLSAESFYVHAMKPETLYGGLMNVGVAGAFHGLGRLTGKMGRDIAGHAGEQVANDASAIEGIIKSVQEAGGTSQEASEAIKKVQAMAVERAQLPLGERSVLDGPVASYIKSQAGGDADVARRLMRHYRDGGKVLDKLDEEMGSLASKADGHMTELVNGLSQLEDARLSMKFSAIRQAADGSSIVQAHDAANSWLRELRAIIEPPAMPPGPGTPEGHLKRVLKEWKSQGVKAPQDPQAAEEFMAKARGFADASHASATAEHEAEVGRLMAEREAKVDPEIRRMFGDPTTRVGFSAKDLGKLQSLLGDVQREVNAGRKVGGQEGVARIFTAIDDSRAITGSMAKFGKMTSDSAKMFERYIYNNRLKPLLEDSNVWGSKLAELQSVNNDAVTHSIQAIGDMKSKFFGSLDSVGGRKILTPNGNTQRFLEKLGSPDGSNDFAEQMVRRVTESARARGAAMRSTMDLPPELHSTIAKTQKAASELEKLMDQASATAADGREIRAMKAREAHNGQHGLLGGLATHAAAVVAGPMGAGLVGGGQVVYNIAKNPVKTLEWIGRFRKAEMAVKGMTSAESKGFLAGDTVPTVKPMLSEAERTAATQSLADLQRYQSDPRNLAFAIKTALGDMVEAAPRTATAVALTMARGVMALAKRAPQPLPPKFTDKPGQVRYANGDLEKFWRDKQLVERPMVVMRLMRSGQLHQDDIGLMQEVVPRIFGQMQAGLEVDTHQARMKGELRHMSYQEQMSLSWMLGRPLDSTQEPSFVFAMQQSAAQDPTNQAAFGQSAEGGGRPSKLNNINLERYETLQERLDS